MIIVSYVLANAISQVAAPFVVKSLDGMRIIMLLLTLVQSILTIGVIFATKVDLAICLCVLLGLTGGR